MFKMNSTQSAKARENLINNQLKPWGSLNYKSNNVLMGIPRANFVPEKYKNFAFSDIKIPLSKKTSMFEPKVEGRILDSLNIKPSDNILEIGTGSGYLCSVYSWCQLPCRPVKGFNYQGGEVDSSTPAGGR